MGGGNMKGGRDWIVVEGRCKAIGCLVLFIKSSTLLLPMMVCF